MKIPSAVLSTILLAAMFICSATVQDTHAQAVVPGVSAGDSFVYTLRIFWSSTDPNATCPAALVEFNKTAWVRLDITDVYNETVTREETYCFVNGTELHRGPFQWEIDKGSGSGFWILVAMFCGANRSAGDLVYPNSTNPFAPVINETSVRQYQSGQRETNHVTANMTDPPDDADFNVYGYFDIYFDKATGVSVEYYMEKCSMHNSTETIYERVSFQSMLESSSVWVVPEYPLYYLLSLFIIPTLLASTIRKKKLNPSADRPR